MSASNVPATTQSQRVPEASGDASLEADVRFDMRGTVLGLVVLALLGGAGIVVFFLGGGLELVKTVPGGLAIAAAGVLFLVVALTAVALLRTPNLPTSAGVARGFMGGCAVTLTSGVVLLVLIFAAGVSAALAFVQTCAESCGPPPAQKQAPQKR